MTRMSRSRVRRRCASLTRAILGRGETVGQGRKGRGQLRSRRGMLEFKIIVPGFGGYCRKVTVEKLQ